MLIGMDHINFQDFSFKNWIFKFIILSTTKTVGVELVKGTVHQHTAL